MSLSQKTDEFESWVNNLIKDSILPPCKESFGMLSDTTRRCVSLVRIAEEEKEHQLRLLNDAQYANGPSRLKNDRKSLNRDFLADREAKLMGFDKVLSSDIRSGYAYELHIGSLSYLI